jgi:hypothetical protein
MVSYRQRMAAEKTPLTPGTRVGVHFGGRVVAAFVIEDRGVFAGERIVRVHIGELEDTEAPEFELPVDELEPVPAAA